LAQCDIANFKKLKSDPHRSPWQRPSRNEISKADWNKLGGFYLGAKRHFTEHADPIRSTRTSPLKSWRTTGSMVGYYEILPYANG